MARASVIWVVKAPVPFSNGCFTTIATFTVKHECARWLRSDPWPTMHGWLVDRMPDGPTTGEIVKSVPVYRFREDA